MPRFAIAWDCGHGSYNCEIIEVDDLAAAKKESYERWRQEAEDNADYQAKEIPAEVDTVEYSAVWGFAYYDANEEEVDVDESDDDG